MARRRDIEEERADLRRLKDVPAGEAEPALACALQECVVALVERVAEVATHHSLKQLTPLILEMISLLRDRELLPHVAVARAIAKVGTEAASLVLRLRAELGGDEPELLGACYSGVLRIKDYRRLGRLGSSRASKTKPGPRRQ